MHTAFFAVGAVFLAIAVAATTTGNDIAWSTFLALALVFLVLAFALDRGDDAGAAADSSDATGSSTSIDEDV